jgi:MFS family permease
MTAVTDPVEMAAERDPGRWMVLAAAIMATLATVLDGTLMGLIAPAVSADLGVDPATIGLISTISVLMMAAFILGGGTLGDIYGRKRFLIYGLIGLIITSVLAFVAPSAAILIPVRALAGITSAVVNPLALAVITLVFAKEERPKAMGLYGAAIGIVGGGGSLVISFLNQQFGWRSTFFLGGVLAAIALLMVVRYVQESKAASGKVVDWLGILLTAAGLFGVIFGINQAATQGFASPAVLVPVGIGLVVLVILVLYSRNKVDPALQLVLFKKPVFSVGVLIWAMISFAAMGPFFQLSRYLQWLQKVTPIQAALTLLPFTLAMFVFAILAGQWTVKYGSKLLITGGLVVMAVGLVAMGFLLSPTAAFWVFLLPLAFLGGGYSIANTPRLSAVLGSAPPELAGSASATNNAIGQLGSALGIATMGALFQGFARGTYNADLVEMGFSTEQIAKSIEVLREWLKTNSVDVAAQFGITVRQLEGAVAEYQHAFTTGVSMILWVGAAVVVVGAVLAWLTFGKSEG